MNSLRFFAACLFSATALLAQLADIAPFAHPCCSEDSHKLQTTFDYNHPRGLVQARDGRFIYGLQWAEERDLFEVAVDFREPHDAAHAQVQYWFLNWPYNPPRMPTIEDPVDDPWQGNWLTAKTRVGCEGRHCRFTFEPLAETENQRARNLPGVTYRRTIRFRLVFPPGSRPEIEAIHVYSQSLVKPVSLRVQLDVDRRSRGKVNPEFEAYNGWIKSVKRSRDGAILEVDAIDPRPAGSNDITVLQVRNGQDAFSFIPSDAERGPMYVPDYHAWITLASDSRPFSKSIVSRGARIRERLAVEPEQSYERASAEIPALDPVERQGGRLYLPLAPDASWQKFALEWGGNVTISKVGTKAMGRERQRLTWRGDQISWRIGTGQTPSFRPRSEDSTLSVLEDYLPVPQSHWSSEGIDYTEEAFAIPLSGPLSPEDPGRSEQTPAVLMMRLRAKNISSSSAAHIWIGMRPAEPLEFNNGFLVADGGKSVRAHIRVPEGAIASIESCKDEGSTIAALHLTRTLRPDEEAITILALPFIPGLRSEEQARIAALQYEAERPRIVDYWRGVIGAGMPFRVPEPRFNAFARGLIAHVRISTTKDPKSGLYMVPAASYRYRVFANEASFQAQLLDVAGHYRLAENYMQTFIDLQGSRPLVGSFSGDQSGVYHGTRVDADYDYTASPYNLDHGTVLWTLAEHYFITRDRAWLARAAPSMKRAADWITAQRQLTKVMVDGKTCPEYGLLPAGHLEDNRDWGHWVSVNAYASAGMSGLARTLEEIGDVDAAKYREEAERYRQDLRTAVLRAAAEAPVIRLRDNTWVPYVPTRVHQRIPLFGPLRVAFYSRYPEKVLPTYRLSATRELLYGPLILVDTGVFDAQEPLATWVLDDWEDNATMSEPLGLHVHGWVDEKYWFSRGGMVFQANLQNPIRTYLRRGEARAAIRNLYNDFVACYYPTVNVFTEEFRQWRSPSGPFYKVPDEAKFVHRLRDLLVMEHKGNLHLAAGTPVRWLAPGQRIEVTAAPTYFGPVSYGLEASAEEVRGTIDLPSRNPFSTAWLNVRLPEGRQMASVFIDDKAWSDFDVAASRIRLPKRQGRMHITVKLARK